MRWWLWTLGLALGMVGCEDGAEVPDGAPPPAVDGGPALDQAVADQSIAERAGQGAPCARAAECLSGFCVRGPDDVQVCSSLCDEDADCPTAWTCSQVRNTGADTTLICLPDEGPCAGVDLQTDPDHCGACDTRCAWPNRAALCVDGACTPGPCLAGFHDLDGDAETGCEYACTVTRGGVEACDRIDNDCDGVEDEGFDLQTDAAHCGACGAACQLRDATAACEAGVCVISGCAPGRVDADGDPANGCEAGACAPEAERCNGLDDDCDGAADEDTDPLTDVAHCGGCGQACAPPGATPACVAGACTVAGCLPGFHDLDGAPENGCEYACAPRGDEVCDGRDDDCDGAVDEGFDLQADPAHCGGCGVACARPGAVVRCDEGACALAGCEDGAVDLDGAYETGCEYACAASGPEVCDGIDNDCDGAVDEEVDLQRDVRHCGRCGRLCAFDFGVPACEAGDCVLQACTPGHVDLDGDPRTGCEYACAPTGAEQCNGQDDDCDGAVDEAFDLRADVQHCGACGQACVFPGATPVCVAGACRIDGCVEGLVDADGEAANGCECAPSGPEVCDGADQDCDGRVDEGFDLSGDPANCGACGQACAFPQAEALCSQGACRLGACEAGFVDADGDPATGCECTPAPEACDGADNDCDGRTDEGFDLDFDGANCGGCGLSCERPNAWTRCEQRTCLLRFCDEGFVDADGALENGCEVRCAETPDAPGCGAPVAYPGRYDAEPQIVYGCVDLFNGDDVLNLDVRAFDFSVVAGVLDVEGAPALMSQRPAPDGADFEVRGVLPGGDLGCTETYVLRGSFDSPDTWTGRLSLSFAGLVCGFTTCTDQSWQVSGRRLP